MRQNARDAFYIHCPYPKKDKLEKVCLLNRDEQKFLYALSILYTEDNFFLHRAALGSILIFGYAAVNLFTYEMVTEYLNRLVKNTEIKYQKLAKKHNYKTPIEEVIDKELVRKFRIVRFFQSCCFLLFTAAALKLYWLLRSRISKKLERSAHESVSSLGPVYAQSGNSYYEKCIVFNLFLRSLGFPYYTEQGDLKKIAKEKYPRSLLITEKRQVYVNKLKEHGVIKEEALS